LLLTGGFTQMGCEDNHCKLVQRQQKDRGGQPRGKAGLRPGHSVRLTKGASLRWRRSRHIPIQQECLANKLRQVSSSCYPQRLAHSARAESAWLAALLVLTGRSAHSGTPERSGKAGMTARLYRTALHHCAALLLFVCLCCRLQGRRVGTEPFLTAQSSQRHGIFDLVRCCTYISIYTASHREFHTCHTTP
jgi:hypothetical protein